jgi:RNA polymerase-interacting CarD/CdnL/TRCF family regulator
LYYQVVTDDAVLWIPVDDTTALTLRSVTPKRDLSECRRSLSSRPVLLNRDHKKRRVELESRLKNRSLLATCETVRDLTALGRAKPLSDSEDRLLERLFKVLCEEWSAADGVTLSHARQEVQALLSTENGQSQ